MKNEETYLVTLSQLASIVDYCVHMTVAGSSVNKDWTHNVEEAIGLNETKTTLMNKIRLPKFSSELDTAIVKTKKEMLEEIGNKIKFYKEYAPTHLGEEYRQGWIQSGMKLKGQLNDLLSTLNHDSN